MDFVVELQPSPGSTWASVTVGGPKRVFVFADRTYDEVSIASSFPSAAVADYAAGQPKIRVQIKDTAILLKAIPDVDDAIKNPGRVKMRFTRRTGAAIAPLDVDLGATAPGGVWEASDFQIRAALTTIVTTASGQNFEDDFEVTLVENGQVWNSLRLPASVIIKIKR